MSIEKDEQTIKSINKVVLYTMKQVKDAYLDGSFSFENPFLRLNYDINFDENFLPVFNTETKDFEQFLMTTLYKYTNYSSLVLNKVGEKILVDITSKDLNFINTLHDLIKKNELTYNVIKNHRYTTKLEVELSVFESNNPSKKSIIRGYYIFNISPLCIDKPLKTGFYTIDVGFDFGNFNWSSINPDTFNALFDTAIYNFEAGLKSLVVKQAQIVINKLIVTPETQEMASSFLNNLDKNTIVNAIIFNQEKTIAPRIKVLIYNHSERKIELDKEYIFTEALYDILKLIIEAESQTISTKKIAQELNIAKGTVNQNVKRIKEQAPILKKYLTNKRISKNDGEYSLNINTSKLICK